MSLIVARPVMASEARPSRSRHRLPPAPHGKRSEAISCPPQPAAIRHGERSEAISFPPRPRLPHRPSVSLTVWLSRPVPCLFICPSPLCVLCALVVKTPERFTTKAQRTQRRQAGQFPIRPVLSRPSCSSLSNLPQKNPARGKRGDPRGTGPHPFRFLSFLPPHPASLRPWPSPSLRVESCLQDREGIHQARAIAVPGLEGGSKLPHSKARFARGWGRR